MDPRRDLVIKVKYGDSLKRFTASVIGNTFDQDIAKLREKIILAFNLSPSTDFILTYTDVDGDTVMLDDDNDLYDAAINQMLNPLRINVQLQSQSYSPPAAEPKPNATSSTPSPADRLNQLYESATSRLVNPVRCNIRMYPQSDSAPAAEPKPVGATFEEVLRSLPEPLSSRVSMLSEDVLAKVASSPIVTELLRTFKPNQPANGNPSSSASSTKGTAPEASKNASKEPKTSVPISDKGAGSGCPDDNKNEAGSEMRGCKGKAVMQDVPQNATLHGPQPAPPQPTQRGPHHHPFAYGFSPIIAPARGPAPPPPPHVRDFAFFGGGGNAYAPPSDIPPYPTRFFPAGPRYKFDNVFQACHRGVACDGCDITPIYGPRYKSTVKDNYDLCAACFSRFGKEAEYNKIDRPDPLRMTRDFNPHPKFHMPPPVCSVRGPKLRSKLESRFIRDVTVQDGTIVAPSTPFTKIWRMRNNGSSVWPFGTQLVWVGGDQFLSQNFVQLDIPVNGLQLDEEVDIAVDFCAPARAGRYVSYWRLATPSGQKFGQRVWVLIQVEQPNNTKEDGKSTLNLNMPPSCFPPHVIEKLEPNEPHRVTILVPNATANVDPMMVDETEGSTTEPEAETEAEAEADTGTVNGPTPMAMGGVPAAVSYPLIDLSPAPPAEASAGRSVPLEYENEDVLLKELEEMGFKQIDLNKEVLRLNKYDLEQSVEDLCGFSEWDPLLEELKEMGFDDKEKNKKLLVKNGGSIKRVVMDLVAGERAE